MTPYYESGGITIYHGDCRDVLPGLEAVDLVLTDPPYGVGVDYGTFIDDKESLAQLIHQVFPMIQRVAPRIVLTPGNGNQHLYPPPAWTLAWVNMAGAGQNSWGFTCWQPILVWGKDPYRAAGMGARPDVIYKSEPSNIDGHPCAKPIDFWSMLMGRVSVNETDIICDPFMGSGTTLRAAKDLGRRAIGIEIEKKYCEIAARRLDQEVLDLVAVPPAGETP